MRLHAARGVAGDLRRGGIMSEQEQIFHFGDELDKLVNRFRAEYDISYAAIVGTLFMKAQLLCGEAEDRDEGETREPH